MADDKIRIQWFPGHMTKAKREMQEKLNMVDMVIELRDARIPSASKNPMIEELCQNKPRLIVLSKKDKADAAATKLWCSALQNETTRVVALDILKENITARIVEESRLLMQAKEASVPVPFVQWLSECRMSVNPLLLTGYPKKRWLSPEIVRV